MALAPVAASSRESEEYLGLPNRWGCPGTCSGAAGDPRQASLSLSHKLLSRVSRLINELVYKCRFEFWQQVLFRGAGNLGDASGGRE